MENNLWSRRSTNTGKLSLSTSGGTNSNGQQPDTSVKTPFSKRNGGDTSSHGRSNPFGQVTPGALTSPTNASSAFGIGSGAFAGFGMSSSKTPKTPGNPWEASLTTAAAGANKVAAEKAAKDKAVASAIPSSVTASDNKTAVEPGASKASAFLANAHLISHQWVFWYRPPITKANGYIEYEKTLHPIARVSSLEDFFLVYRHLKRPSDLPTVSDYHLFKDGIRPIWEDDINKKGGKWVVRLKKGVADRYWEDLLFAMIGSQFDLDDVCGIVLSVRNGEDIISIWAKSQGQRVLKIRDTMKQVLNFPNDTKVDWKSHDESIQQRVAVEESRREKAAHHHHSEKRGGARTTDPQRQA
ncbi:translation initiation factor eIF4E3 [Zalerion maritima]|uniref:Translation initiation factor eIF4E3 n=1 Tax=Zalerion maritima TaxID=339359 RepID=A0AAD5RNN1_9PEZI|nr:translation initiation factor eIF4E3 [Zalerion maritima]